MLVQIILFDGFDLLDAIAPYEVFTAASMNGADTLDVEFVSTAGARAVPSGPRGLPIPASGTPDLDRADILLIPGAAGPTEGNGPQTVPAILAREAGGALPDLAQAMFSKAGKTVVTVCGGSLVLAMAGVLKGRSAVTHHMGMPLLETAGAIPVKARVVDDGNLVTGGGVTSGLDVALYIVERFQGPRIAHAVETLFEHERRGTVWSNRGAVPIAAGQPPAMDHGRPDAGGSPEPATSGVAGRWDVTIATPLGKQSVTYDIAVANGAVTGTATQGAEVTPLIELAADGNRLTWMQHVTKPMRLTLRFEVVVDGDAMTGTAKAGVLPGSKLVGSRRQEALAVA